MRAAGRGRNGLHRGRRRCLSGGGSSWRARGGLRRGLGVRPRRFGQGRKLFVLLVAGSARKSTSQAESRCSEDDGADLHVGIVSALGRGREKLGESSAKTVGSMAKAPDDPRAKVPPAGEKAAAPSEAKSRPPTGRLARLARLGALAPRALPIAMEGARRALGTKRTEAEQLEAHRRMLVEAKKTAEAMLKTLGEMKGLPLKLGQMASYIDGLAPPGYEEKFQRVLKRLQDKAPPLSPRRRGDRGRRGARHAAREALRRVGTRAVRGGEHRPGAPRAHARRRIGGREGAVPGHRRGTRKRPEEHLVAGVVRRPGGAQVPHQADPRGDSLGLPFRARLRAARPKWPTRSAG